MQKKISTSDRKLIRSVIREEIKRRKVVKEHTSNLRRKMIICETNGNIKGVNREEVNKRLVHIINEDLGLLDNLGGFNFSDTGIFSSAFDVIKRYLIESIVGYLGFSTSPDDIPYKLVENVFEKIDYTELTKYFGTGSCPEVMELLTVAATETVTEIGGRKIILFFATNYLPVGVAALIERNIDSALGRLAQEEINKVTVAIVLGLLEGPIQEYICETDMSEILDAGASALGFDSFDLGTTISGQKTDVEGLAGTISDLFNIDVDEVKDKLGTAIMQGLLR